MADFFIVVLIIALAAIVVYILLTLYSNKTLIAIKNLYKIGENEPGEFEKAVDEYWKRRAELSPRPNDVARTKRIKSSELFERYSISLDTILAGERVFLEEYLSAHSKIQLKAGNKSGAFYIIDIISGKVIYIGSPVARHSGKKLLKEIIKYHKKMHNVQRGIRV
jgi:hypothetical protein